MHITPRKLSLVTALSIAGLVTACGGGSSGSGTGTIGGSSGNGTLAVSMTDAPACGFDDVSVTVSKVRVHQSSSAGESEAGWTDITLNPARRINLLNLTNGVLDALGETPLAAGQYNQVRLVLAANTSSDPMANSVIQTGTTTRLALETPSATQSGIKLVNNFTVAAGQRTDLVLDFDACKSVISRGNSGSYALRPVVKVIPTTLNGIDGFVDPALAGANVMITAQQNGNVISGTAPNPTTGAFSLARLEPGNYDVVITADNRATTVIGAVPVASSSSRVALNTSATPLTMPLALTAGSSISGTVTMTPASTTEVAYVAAKQTLGAGPTVTVKYKGVDVSTNTYTLTQLPTVAPRYSVYSATAPLGFSTVLVSTPGTGKYAVTASATGYASKTNLAVDVLTAAQIGVNFSLTP